jgi:hypothetical protein
MKPEPHGLRRDRLNLQQRLKQKPILNQLRQSQLRLKIQLKPL